MLKEDIVVGLSIRARKRVKKPQVKKAMLFFLAIALGVEAKRKHAPTLINIE
jgi:hypothetical protein